MNIAAFVSGPMVDIFNIGHSPSMKLLFGLTGNRWVIFTTFFTSCTSLCTTYYFLREIDVRDGVTSITSGEYVGIASDSGCSSISDSGDDGGDGDTVDKETFLEMVSVGAADENCLPLAGQHTCFSNDTITSSPVSRPGASCEGEDVTRTSHLQQAALTSGRALRFRRAGGEGEPPTVGEYAGVEQQRRSTKSLVESARGICVSPTFWRFTCLSLFLINLRAIFRHLDATLPTYLTRIFGPDVPKGSIYSINPAIIMVLTPLVGALCSEYAHYDMVSWVSVL
jgi:hypothetical protein